MTLPRIGSFPPQMLTNVSIGMITWKPMRIWCDTLAPNTLRGLSCRPTTNGSPGWLLRLRQSMRSKSWISRSPKSTLLSARNLRMYARLLLIRARAEKRDKPEMRFYVNILTTYFPDRDPPYDAYYQQILEQIQLAEELGFECFMFNEHHFLGYGGLIANPAVMLA